MTSIIRGSGLRLCRAVLLSLLTIAPGIVWGQANAPTPAPLPPAAQEALNNGIIAARVPDYLLAIRYFEEARKLAPAAPIIHLNLGLAESRIGGRELRAIAWFGAYLAANPDAANAAAVREQIAVLAVKNQSNLSHFITSVQSAAGQMSGYKKNEGLQRVAVLWAKAGDISAALNTADLCDDTDSQKSYAYTVVSDVQAKAGDIDGALKTAAMIARNTDDIRRDLTYLGYAHSAIAEAQARAGDPVGAQRTFDYVLRTLALVPDRSRELGEVVQSQARSGDVSGAQKTIELMPDDIYKKFAQDFLAKFDAASAQKARSAVKPLPAVKVSDWLRRLDDTNTNAFILDEVPLRHALFWDLAGYLKSLNASKSGAERMYGERFKPEEDKKIFEDLRQTAEQLIAAQSAIGRMVKHQAGK